MANHSPEEQQRHHQNKTSSNVSFGKTSILPPRTAHTHTAVLLHGRGSTGRDFAEDLLASPLSNQQTLPDKLPGWRWVFPSSPEPWSTTFQDYVPAWFEAHSLSDITARQDLQVDGLRESVRYVLGIVRDEIRQLDGDARKVVLGGISLGGAVGMWALLCRGHLEGRLGAFVGASTWLPFAGNIERVFASKGEPNMNDETRPEGREEFDWFVETMMAATEETHRLPAPVSFTPIFLGHGMDDAYVDVKLGRQAARVLEQLGMTVERKEYSDAEEEGHWFKVPEEMDDILDFLNHHTEPSGWNTAE